MARFSLTLLYLAALLAVSSVAWASDAAVVSLQAIPEANPKDPNAYPKKLVIGTFGKQIDVMYALAVVDDDITLYAFATNDTARTINMNIDAMVKDASGTIIGTGGNYPFDVAAGTKQQMFGYPMYIYGQSMVRLKQSDISGPIILELNLSEK